MCRWNFIFEIKFSGQKAWKRKQWKMIICFFDYPSEEEMENTILHEPNEGEPDPQVGDHNIYFFNLVNPDSSCHAGAD